MKRFIYLFALLIISITLLVSCGGECQHEFGEWKATSLASCNEIGTRARVCSRCRYTEVERVEATGHIYSVNSVGEQYYIGETEDGKYEKYHKSCACGLAGSGVFLNMPADGPQELEFRIVTESAAATAEITAYSGSGAEVIIPDTVGGIPVTAIGDEAFYNKRITSVTLPDGLLIIGKDAFYACSYLESITLPDSLSCIAAGAFSLCSKLTEFHIPSGVTLIGEDVFDYCRSIAAFTVSENNTAYKAIDGTLYSKDGKTLVRYAPAKTNESFTVPSGVTVLGEGAFANNSSLRSVYISKDVEIIGKWPFLACQNIENITVANDNAAYKSIDGNLYSKDGRVLYQYAPAQLTESFTVPEGVEEITYRAFADSCRLKSVTISDSVTYIDSAAFSGCGALERVVIGNGVTRLGFTVFNSCSALKSVIFSNADSWYRTDDIRIWSSRSGGELIDVSSPAAAASLLKDPSIIYWYKS